LGASARSTAAHAISPRISAVHTRIPRPGQSIRRRLLGATFRLAFTALVGFFDFVELKFRDFVEFNRVRLQTPL
jgi:hypothetical protein